MHMLRSRQISIIACCILSLLGHSGCGPIRVVPEDIEPTDLSSIFLNADRASIERTLGSPVSATNFNAGKIAVYSLDLGERGGPTWYYPNIIWADLMLLWIYVREEYRERYEGQRGKITILYDRRERVVWFEMGGLDQQAMTHEAATVTMAERGDDKAQFEVGLRSRPGTEQWQWFCKSANQNNKDAMNFLGTIYYFGLNPYERNWVMSYMWFRLAGFGGKKVPQEDVGYYAWSVGFPSTVPPGKHVREHLPHYPFTTNVFGGMKENKLAEAEKLAQDWRPSPEDCELGPTGQ